MERGDLGETITERRDRQSGPAVFELTLAPYNSEQGEQHSCV